MNTKVKASSEKCDLRLLPVLFKLYEYGKGRKFLNCWNECWLLVQLNTYGANLEITL